MQLSLFLVLATGIVPRVVGQCDEVGISSTQASRVVAEFTSNGVVPDVVPAIDPKVDVRPNYNGKQVDLGNEFSVAETLMEPEILFTPEADRDENTNYTVLFVDPDATSRAMPILRQFFHLAKYDVKPSCVTNQSPKTQLFYMALTPASVSPHRYTQLVYRQPEGTYTPPDPGLLVDVSRGMFDIDKYVAEGQLTLVGGNFFNEGLGTTGNIGKKE